MAKWRERELRADNTSVIVVFFDKAPQVEPPAKKSRLDTPDSEGDTTEVEAEESSDSAQERDKTQDQDPLTSTKPTLVRKLAFRCSCLMFNSCMNHFSNTNSAAGQLSSLTSSNNANSSSVCNCQS